MKYQFYFFLINPLSNPPPMSIKFDNINSSTARSKDVPDVVKRRRQCCKGKPCKERGGGKSLEFCFTFQDIINSRWLIRLVGL